MDDNHDNPRATQLFDFLEKKISCTIERVDKDKLQSKLNVLVEVTKMFNEEEGGIWLMKDGVIL